ncbi:MAG: hypothetical protein JOZ39_00820 [Chloroflexi bacterium]|nr:hypothetical protein [Chloroflexota bacterium]
MTFLFLYAHYLEKRSQVPREAVHAVLTDASVLDNNCRHWLNSAPELFAEGGQVGLRAAGRDRAKEILRELDDPSIAPDWKLGAGGQARSAKASTSTESTDEHAVKALRHRPSAGKKSPVDAWLAAWKALALPVNGHDAIKDRGLLEKGLFGLWAIRRATKDEVKVVGTKSLVKFIFEAFEDKLNARSFEKALSSDAAKGKVVHVKGTSFQIQPPGMELAEQMAGLSLGPASSGHNGQSPAAVQP